jgi:hypothetical protein
VECGKKEDMTIRADFMKPFIMPSGLPNIKNINLMDGLRRMIDEKQTNSCYVFRWYGFNICRLVTTAEI